MMKLWVVGKFLCETEKGRAWDILGIYDSEEIAVENCLDECCFVGSVILNDKSSLEQKEWKGAYYPLSL